MEYAKRILQETHASLFDTACEVGLSGAGRLYDLFVNIEGMTPGEYKNGGENLTIHYSFAESPFGEIFVASTDKGICCLEFTDNHPASIDNLKRKFPNAKYKQIVDGLQQNALFIFTQDWSKLKEIKLHLKGTDFQLKVWEALLKIPMRGLTTYGDIAAGINHPKAFRAVGTAVGENPVGAVQTIINLSVRKGRCISDGNFPTTPVDEEAVYDCALLGSFVGTQKRFCKLGATDGEWTRISGMCVSIVTLVLIIVVAIVVVLILVFLLIRVTRRRKAVHGVKASSKTSASPKKNNKEKATKTNKVKI